MHASSHFRVTDSKILTEFIIDFPFATLVAGYDPFPVASQVPLELREFNGKIILNGHVSAANPQGKFFEQHNIPALAIFTAGHTYVSSSWYKDENVSTWNYRTVQVNGFLHPLTGDELKNHLKRMQARYEKDQPKPMTVDKMSDGYFESQVKGVKGFTMQVEKMYGIWKLSQNRNKEDYATIISELEKINTPDAREVAEEMRKLMR